MSATVRIPHPAPVPLKDWQFEAEGRPNALRRELAETALAARCRPTTQGLARVGTSSPTR